VELKTRKVFSSNKRQLEMIKILRWKEVKL